jgi:hypothetical protein
LSMYCTSLQETTCLIIQTAVKLVHTVWWFCQNVLIYTIIQPSKHLGI